jgi:hypothetical protein
MKKINGKTKERLTLIYGSLFIISMTVIGVFVITFNSWNFSSSRTTLNKENLTMKQILQEASVSIPKIPEVDNIYPTTTVSDSPLKKLCKSDVLWSADNGSTNFLFTFQNPKTGTCEYR